jgi:hypothetical protein
MTFSNEKVLRSLWRFRVINYQVLAQEYEDISRFPSRNMGLQDAVFYFAQLSAPFEEGR